MNIPAPLAVLALALCLAGRLGHADPLPVAQQANVLLHQVCLATLGYDPGPIDGQPGPQTEHAWRQALRHYRTLYPTQIAESPTWAIVALLQDCGKRLMHQVFLLKKLAQRSAAQETPQGWPQPSLPRPPETIGETPWRP